MMSRNKKRNIFLKVILGSSILTGIFFMLIMICVLIVLNFFGVKMTVSTIDNNSDYADSYLAALNNNLKDGYVPLTRMLYFYLENNLLSFDQIYKLNQNKESKSLRDIKIACEDNTFKNMIACSQESITENKSLLESVDQYFNFPIKNDVHYTVTSFFNHERIVYGTPNHHSGWDLAVSQQTPIYSVCSGTVININFTQNENIPYDVSGNKIGNTMTIKCDDYGTPTYVTFAHLFPNSSKVNVNQKVDHWTQLASAGTTGYSTGNHIHYEVKDENKTLIDGMALVDMKL